MDVIDRVREHYNMAKTFIPEGVTPWITPMQKENHKTWDRFDGGCYSYESYEPASGGKEMVIF